MKTLRYLFLACLLGVMAMDGVAAEMKPYRVADVPNVQLKDSTRFVSDPPDAINAADEAALNSRIARLRDSLGVEIAIVVIPMYDASVYGSAREFANELFNTWGIGDKETNRGLLIQLITYKRQREITFETGYGLEGELTDGLCKLIQERRMIPIMKDGRYGEGLLAGLEEVSKALQGRSTLEAEKREANKRLAIILASIWWLLGAAAFGWLLYLHRRTAKEPENLFNVQETNRYDNIIVIVAGVLLLQLPAALLYFLVKLLISRQLTPRIKCPKCGVVSSFRQEKGYPVKQKKKKGTLRIYHYICCNCGYVKVEKLYERKENWWSGDGGGGGSYRDLSDRDNSSSWSSGSGGGSWGGGSSGGGGASSRF